MINRLEFHHLLTFQAAASHLHFRKAAEELRCSQPVVTRRIKELEEILGYSLFSRDTRNVALLPQGQVFLEHIPKILREAEIACERARSVASKNLGILRIGVIGMPAFDFLHRPLIAFRKQYPDFEVKLEENSSSSIAQQIVDGILDCGLFLNSVTHPEIEQQIVATDQMAFAVSVNHPLADKGALQFSQLEGEKLILFPRERNPTLYDQLTKAVPGVSVDQIIESSSRNGAIMMAAADMGIAVIAESMRRLCPDSTRFIPLAGASAGVDIVLGWKRGTPNPLEAFL